LQRQLRKAVGVRIHEQNPLELRTFGVIISRKYAPDVPQKAIEIAAQTSFSVKVPCQPID
jgi:hypothetical protein